MKRTLATFVAGGAAALLAAALIVFALLVEPRINAVVGFDDVLVRNTLTNNGTSTLHGDTTIDSTAQLKITSGKGVAISTVSGTAAQPKVLSLVGNPNGTITAPVGSLLLDTSVPAMWINLDGATAWGPPAAQTSTSAIFGVGADGDANCFDGATTCLGLVPAAGVYTLTRWISPRNMTVSVGARIKLGGYGIYGSGTLTNNGTIDDKGANATSTTGAGVRAAAWYGTTVGGGASNGAGTASSSVLPAPYVTSSTTSTGGPPGVGGSIGGPCQGGGGGGGVANTGGGGGAVTVTVATSGGPLWPAIVQSGRVSPALAGILTYGSGGGGGGTSADGGGGGAGGGIAYVAFRHMLGSGLIDANGGNGFAAASVGGGGGGGGGGYVVVTFETAATTLTVSAAGGTGGAGGAGGGPGGPGGACVVLCYNLGAGVAPTGCP